MSQIIETLSPGIEAMNNERTRQVNVKGYDDEHDDEHEPWELIAAGKCYVEWALWDMQGSSGDSPPFDWPWEESDWKPEESAVENLVKGGALCAAAFDRIEREVFNG